MEEAPFKAESLLTPVLPRRRGMLENILESNNSCKEKIDDSNVPESSKLKYGRRRT